MNTKKKGIDAERALVRQFWECGWAALRVAGSGSSHYPSPDILAGKEGRRLAIECKITAAAKKYFPKTEISHLRYFSEVFGAESWLAVKFPGIEWYFFTVEDLQETNTSLVATPQLAKLKGLTFEELIGQSTLD